MLKAVIEVRAVGCTARIGVRSTSDFGDFDRAGRGLARDTRWGMAGAFMLDPATERSRL